VFAEFDATTFCFGIAAQNVDEERRIEDHRSASVPSLESSTVIRSRRSDRVAIRRFLPSATASRSSSAAPSSGMP
jgi:hypothetical protein